LTESALDVPQVHVDRTLAPASNEDALGATQRGGVDRLRRLRDGKVKVQAYRPGREILIRRGV
jgi:hypothetical protein